VNALMIRASIFFGRDDGLPDQVPAMTAGDTSCIEGGLRLGLD
jgi:hypothetical protein